MKKVSLLLGLAAIQTFAQSSSSATAIPMQNPLSVATRYMYNTSKSDVLKAATEMPEKNYSFKPVPAVRSFGQLVAHLADSQYEFCSAVIGDGRQPPGVEKSKTSKADLIQALKDAFEYCDQIYNSMTDAHASEIIKLFGHDTPKLGVLSSNASHNLEHYGQMATYLQIKGLAPPSSRQQSMH